VQTNLEITRQLFSAFNEHGVEGVLPYYAEDCEVYDPDVPGNTSYRGKEGLRTFLNMILMGTEQTEIRDFALLPAGDRVVALNRTYFRGEGGGPEVEVRDAHTLTFRDGKVVYWRLYVNQTEALTDAGLDPDLATVRT
jgi:limonene-1,2-epoxide hydrolase